MTSLCSASTTWTDCKQLVTAKRDQLAQTNVTSKVAELTQELAKTSPNSSTIERLSNELQEIKTSYSSLYKSVFNFIKRNAAEPSLSELLAENGTLQTSIHNMHTLKKKMKVDVESAVARDEQLRSKDTAITSHKLYAMDRPLRRERLPYWWVLGVFFIGVAVFLFRQTGVEAGLIQSSAVTISTLSSLSLSERIVQFLQQKNTLIGIIIICILSIIGLGIRMATM